MTGSLLTAAEVAELLGVPKSWVYEQSRAGRIPTVSLGRYRRYRREAIEAWVEQLAVPARALVPMQAGAPVDLCRTGVAGERRASSA
jgi:excisionase family DNA binding protein